MVHAAVGTVGNVTSRTFGIGEVVGTYEIVGASPVPLPATLPLLLAGVAAVGLIRRRKA